MHASSHLHPPCQYRDNLQTQPRPQAQRSSRNEYIRNPPPHRRRLCKGPPIPNRQRLATRKVPINPHEPLGLSANHWAIISMQKPSPSPSNPMNVRSSTLPLKLRIWQQNAHKSKTAHSYILNNANPNNWDIIALQEPWFDSYGNSCGTQYWRVVYPENFYMEGRD